MGEQIRGYEFAEFRLDPKQRLLRRNGDTTVPLTPKAFDILLFLVQNSGHVVEKDKLMRALWPGSFVEEGNISQNIFILRKALGDDHDSRRFIETIPKVGYQFVAPVEQIDVSTRENGLQLNEIRTLSGHGVQENAEFHNESTVRSAERKYWSQHSPFRALQVFEPQDSWLFFGRELDTQELLSRLSQSPVLIIIGNSGSGKSSLVRAGLIPALQQADSWRIALFRPSSSPFDYVAEVLPSQLAPELSLPEQTQFIGDCRNKFPAREDALRNAVTTLASAKGAQPRCTRILLVADQFEELFTLTQNQKVRHQYIDALLTASHLDGAIPVHLVITMRADFYPHCLEHAGLSRCLEANLYNVRKMIPEQLRESIEKRMALASVCAEPGLIDSLLEDVGSEPGNLALLEHALGQLWEKCGGFGSTLTYQAYAHIGRLSGALGKHANNVYQGLANDKQKRLARRIFLEVVHLGEGAHDTRRRVLKQDLLSFGDPEEVDHLLAFLASSRLITTGREGDQTFVEVSHEMLIQEWDLLREWIQEDREELHLERRLHQTAEEWQALNREAPALLRGARLAQGEEWLFRHPEEHALLREFLQASIAARVEAERNERESRERELDEQLERERQAQNQRLKRMTAGFLFLALLLGAVFVWRFITTTVIARRDRIVQDQLKQINELERSLNEMRKQEIESQKHADDFQALVQNQHESQVKLSRDLEARQTLADMQRTEILQIKQKQAEMQKVLDDEKAKVTAEKTETTKLKQENQLFQDQIERYKLEISNFNKPKLNQSEVEQNAAPGGAPLIAVSLDVAVFNDKVHAVAAGLEKNSFRIFEDHVEQNLTQFSTVAGPWSIGIVLDMSQYVDDLQSLRKAATAFIKALHPGDEFFVVGNSVAGNKDQPRVCQRFRNVESFENGTDPLEMLGSVKPRGRRVVLDAISVALDEMRNAKHLHQAILVFSVDRTDSSRHTEREVLEAVRKNNVQIYGISIADPDISSLASMQSIMRDITKQSGGHLFEILSKELTDAATNIATRLHTLYVLEYAPTNQQRDRRYRRISVKLTSPRSLRNVGLDYRQGYYAKAQ